MHQHPSTPKHGIDKDFSNTPTVHSDEGFSYMPSAAELEFWDEYEAHLKHSTPSRTPRATPMLKSPTSSAVAAALSGMKDSNYGDNPSLSTPSGFEYDRDRRDIFATEHTAALVEQATTLARTTNMDIIVLAYRPERPAHSFTSFFSPGIIVDSDCSDFKDHISANFRSICDIRRDVFLSKLPSRNSKGRETTSPLISQPTTPSRRHAAPIPSSSPFISSQSRMFPSSISSPNSTQPFSSSPSPSGSSSFATKPGKLHPNIVDFLTSHYGATYQQLGRVESILQCKNPAEWLGEIMAVVNLASGDVDSFNVLLRNPRI